MKRYVWMSALAALTITFSATAAQATPITLDFTAGKYAGAHNEWHFETVDQGVTVDLWSGVFEKLTYDAVNGIGIDGWGGDNGEVGDDELVLSGFSPDQYIYEVELAQLFAIGSYAETGYYRLNNSGGWIPFAATNSDGSYSLIINKSVSSIAFTGDCEVGCSLRRRLLNQVH